MVRRARELKALDGHTLARLERHLVSEAVAQGLLEETAEVARLGATVTLTIEGKEVLLSDLDRLLIREHSASKRRALWKASLVAVQRVDAVIARLEAKEQDLLTRLEVPSALALGLATRELDLDELARAAEDFLARTDEAWRHHLLVLADRNVQLKPAALHPADLPSVMRVYGEIDWAFPPPTLAARTLEVLRRLEVLTAPGLTLALDDDANRNPLPLTVAPGGAREVRVSFRPRGGLRDQRALLFELGHALALKHITTGRVVDERLRLRANTRSLGHHEPILRSDGVVHFKSMEELEEALGAPEAYGEWHPAWALPQEQSHKPQVDGPEEKAPYQERVPRTCDCPSTTGHQEQGEHQRGDCITDRGLLQHVVPSDEVRGHSCGHPAQSACSNHHEPAP